MSIMRGDGTSSKIEKGNTGPNREPQTPKPDTSMPRDAGMAIKAPMKK